MTGERDPRAHWLDDDPFDKRTSPGSHTKARDDGNWRQPHIRVVHATPGSGAPFVRIFGFEEQTRPIPVHTGSIWHFSKTEILHLTRSSGGGLRFGVILAALTGLVLMAPGAVMVAGKTTKEQFGKIALAGPVSNVVLWCIGLAAAVTIGGISGFLDELIRFWLIANSILGAFNMLPFGPLDGKKIRTWSIPIFWIWLIICFSTAFFTFTQLSLIL